MGIFNNSEICNGIITQDKPYHAEIVKQIF